ncbi:NADP-dependent oxidoreductase [Sphingomonas sp.]|jgi:NADPH:quinone reductase-like Zn-dependent oxidoreductase|uniref:NADP-dependent oxidoreductase n=1 Tax=Sphingomonas sp. TaxID=28214 RepID=UPI0026330E29|nr:NADP-dependent oxidoreductase [Sphingomonas sp.]MDF2495356.1 hypothetical protein [Sphingomonas sp.]
MPTNDHGTPSDIQPVEAKAVSYSGIGGPEVISIATRTVRPPAAGEVRLRVQAAAVNPTDVAWRDPGRPDGHWPLTPGMDAAGVVEAVGPGVSRLAVGDQVMAAVMPARPEGGAQATYIVVPEVSVVPIPAATTITEAATLPMNGLTALYALENAGLSKGQVLAVSGGAGLLAHYAIAIANRRGITVVADAKPEEHDLVRGYGATVVVTRSDDFAGAVREQFPDGADALLDTALLGERGFGALRDGGVYLPVRGWAKESERGIQVKPVWVSKVLDRTDWLEQLRGWVEDGTIKLRVAAEFPLSEVAAAQQVLSAGGLRGRPVLTL